MTTPTETAIPETLTRSEAHRKLLALGMPANVVTHVLDHPDELLHLFSPMPTVVPSKEAVAIVEAYQRHCKSKATTDPLDTVPADERPRILAAAHRIAARHCRDIDAYTTTYNDALSREAAAYRARQQDEARIAAVFGDKPRTMAQFRGPDGAPDDDSDPVLTPAEEAEIIASAPGQIGPGLTPIGAALADIHAARGVPEFQPGYHHPDPTIDAEVRADLAEGRAINASAGVREGWHRGWIPTTDATPETPAATSTIAAAFEAMLAFFICLIGPRPHRKITPAEEIGALAACEVETDFTPDSPPTDLTRLRDLIQRAAEEYAQIRAEASKRLDRGDASRRERKAADLAAGPVTEEELAEIEARTSGPGPLAGDGELLRRCRAEIERLRGNVETLETKLADAQGEHGRLTAERSELLAALGTGKVWVCSKCPAVSPADAEYEVGNMEPCVYCEDGTARVVLGKGQDYLSALRGEGWTVAVHNDYRLNGESRTFWLFTKDGRAIKGEGRTDEEALSLCVAASGDLPSVTAALLRASRGETGPAAEDQREAALLRRHDSFDRSAPAPGHVSIPRRALEKLVDATQRDELVREAREAAEHVLLHDALRHEPARHDAEAARVAAKRGGQ